jgi:hypothetical protein
MGLDVTAPRSCGDCGAKPGEFHDDGCDVARCLVTGFQRLQCTLRHDCGEQTWSGEWPGVAECEEFDWWAYESPATQKWMRENGIPGWDKPHCNLNRLAPECEWDHLARRYRRRGDPVDDTVFVHWHLDRGLFLEPSARYTVDGVTLPAAELVARLGRAS